MNESPTPNHDVPTGLSIAVKAEFQRWENIRDLSRRQLSGTITIGFLYLMGSLAVGGYLLVTIREIAKDAAILRGWQVETIEIGWMDQVAWCYVVIALGAVILFPCLLLLIQGKSPSFLARWLEHLPWIGSTMRIIAIGDFCQSIYHGILQSQTYETAFATAAENVRHPGLSRWAMDSSKQIQAGRSPSSVLANSPIRDQPLTVVSVMVDSDLSAEQTVATWHDTTAQCHHLAESRAHRAKQFISTSTLLVCVMLAAFALLVSAVFMTSMISGLAQGYYSFLPFLSCLPCLSCHLPT